MMNRGTCLSLAHGAVGAIALLSLSVYAAELPVRHVILYKHGIGYFERSGRLAPGESARLDFKASDMNDVLKSLTLTQKGDGAITGLRYDASEPLARKLDEFPFHIGERQPLSAVIDQLKGARVELRFGEEKVAGTIVGARTVAAREREPEREQVNLMLDTGELRVFDLATASGVRFPDPGLRKQFQDYLQALLSARSKEKRSIYIDSSGTRARDITAGYMVPMPVWKSSYRLIFDASSQPMIEGWAIVDNTTGEDWSNVRMSLVSGRPVSFVSRLYEPRYVVRPTAELPEERSQAPAIHGGAVREYAPAAPAPRAAAKPAPVPREPARARAEASSIATTASASEAGELFEYRISNAVTVRKSESAMLPFIQQRIAARKVLIYADQRSAHPMNAAELTNSTGKTLDGGPLTVYDGGVYGGEALMESFKASDKRLISYAVDLGTRITTHFDSKGETVRELHASRGLLTTRIAHQETRNYTIGNLDQKAKVLIIEHPARLGYTLMGRTPSEKTATAYRFEVKLAAGARESFPVAEERVYETSTSVTNLTPDVIFTYVQNKALSAAARKQLEEVGRRKQHIAGLETDIRDADRQIKDIATDQDRIRKNLSSLNRVSSQQELVQKYARQLADQEIRLAGLNDRKAELERERNAAQQALNRLLESLAF